MVDCADVTDSFAEQERLTDRIVTSDKSRTICFDITSLINGFALILIASVILINLYFILYCLLNYTVIHKNVAVHV